MATPTEIELDTMGVNILTKAEYDALTTKNDNEFYLITDDVSDVMHTITITTTDVGTSSTIAFSFKGGQEEAYANAQSLPNMTVTASGGSFIGATLASLVMAYKVKISNGAITLYYMKGNSSPATITLSAISDFEDIVTHL